MGFSSIALPGSMPTFGSGKAQISPESLFSSSKEMDDYQRRIDGVPSGSAPEIKVKKVSVRIFDLSDAKQIEEYEKLWAELLEKASRMEVLVDHHKDLVRRPDGTSYWMKYVEYVEFGSASDKEQKDKESR